MTIEHGKLDLQTACSDAEAGTLLLPNFQRGFVWKPDMQANLVASVLLDIPSGALLLIRGEQDNFNCRSIGSRNPFVVHESSFPCRFLLDGQQRLTTLRQVYGDPFAQSWNEVWDASPPNLRYRWTCRVKPHSEDSGDDLFGYTALEFGGLPPEPELLVSGAVVPLPIRKTKDLDQWFHPAFLKEAGTEERHLQISLRAAHEGLIPLWGILHDADDARSVAALTLRHIATSRREELLASYVDGNLPDDLVAALRNEARAGGVQADEREMVQLALIERANQWRTRVLDALTRSRRYMFSTIDLHRDELAKAVVVFESINRGGQPLKVFDLISAKYASLDVQGRPLADQVIDHLEAASNSVPSALRSRADWSAREGILISDGSLTAPFTNAFLQVLSCSDHVRRNPAEGLSTLSVTQIKKEMFLRLTPSQIAEGWRPAVEAVRDAWMFLQLRCGVAGESSLRNKMLLLPLAFAFSQVAPTKRNRVFFNKVEYWYWASVLTNVYIANQNERAIQDSRDLLLWLTKKSHENPFKSRGDKALDVEQYSDKETLLREGEEFVGADVDTYLLQFVTAQGAMDPLTAEPLLVWKQEVHDHHLIPLGSATSVGQSSSEIRRGNSELARLLNSPLNRAYILADSNLQISDKPLHQYLQDIQPVAQASLFLPAETIAELGGASSVEAARRVMGERFNRLRAAVTNHLTQLST